jgi:serine/threonine-protein kinase
MNIGRYTILGLLGRGGMGAVYKAAMPVAGRIVALKVCRPAEIMADVMGLGAVEEMFLQEAVTMAGIEHPNVASILDVDPGEPLPQGHEDMEPEELAGRTPPHFSMGYYCNNLGVLMGENYEVERPSRLLGADRSLDIAAQMLAGLDRLHYEGIVHRDVKPFNVMLADRDNGRDRVKLIDFGLSRLRGEPTKGHKSMVVGSPYYTAPEQEADPDKADARADCYSVGVTLFRMLTGRLPDQGGAGRTVSDLHPDLDQRWDAFFQTALAPDPDKRFAHARAMLDGLGDLADHWRAHRDSVCSFFDEETVPRRKQDWKPRSEPLKTGTRTAQQTFGLDELWRPKQYGCGGFEDKNNGTVLDSCTGLLWEQGGSRFALSRHKAEAHVRRLNRNRLGGRTDWRLPTVEELCTLFTGASEPGRFCIESVFDPHKARLWSADTKSYTAAWYADAELGFIWWQDTTCRFHARAVAG